MTQDQIIEWAREAGFKQRLNSQNEWWMLTPDIANFAAIVADHAAKQEREACAKACQQLEVAIDGGGNHYYRPADARQCVTAIRARGTT